MKILDIRETRVALQSAMRNAVFDFSEMTTSVVAVVTDVIVEDKPVVGFAFNSTGRYACGDVMRSRMIPRLLKADPQSLLDPATGLIDPERALACMMQREKPGGHTERSIAVGTIEVAIWDALAKAQRLPLHVLLAQRYTQQACPDRVPCYVGGGWYQPGKGLSDLCDEIRMRLDQGYTTMKIKVGGRVCPKTCNGWKLPFRWWAVQTNWLLTPMRVLLLSAVANTPKPWRAMACAGLKSRQIRWTLP